jgi:hypothetical protein
MIYTELIKDGTPKYLERAADDNVRWSLVTSVMGRKSEASTYALGH